jgi:hypothetical protein
MAAGLRFTPDLVLIGGQIVADIKYKLLGEDWNRADLYQIIAFGTAFQSANAAVLGFRHASDGKRPRSLVVGPLAVRAICWPADPALSAESAATQFSDEVRSWLGQCDLDEYRERTRQRNNRA